MKKVFEIKLPIVRLPRSRNKLSMLLARCKAALWSAFQPMDEDSIPQPLDAWLHLSAHELSYPLLANLLLASIPNSQSNIIETKRLPQGLSGWVTTISTKYSKGVIASSKLLITLKGNDLFLRIYARDPSLLLRTALKYSYLK